MPALGFLAFSCSAIQRMRVLRTWKLELLSRLPLSTHFRMYLINSSSCEKDPLIGANRFACSCASGKLSSNLRER